jgi:hypothetical protein
MGKCFWGVESGVTLLKNKLLLGLAATIGFLLCEEEEASVNQLELATASEDEGAGGFGLDMGVWTWLSATGGIISAF